MRKRTIVLHIQRRWRIVIAYACAIVQEPGMWIVLNQKEKKEKGRIHTEWN